MAGPVKEFTAIDKDPSIPMEPEQKKKSQGNVRYIFITNLQ